MKVYIIGVGMGSADNMTIEAVRAAETADLLIGSKRALDALDRRSENVFCAWKPQEILRIINENSMKFSTAAVLVTGDSGFFSGAQSIAEALVGHDIEIVCGISACSYFFSRLKLPWQNAKFVSLHGKNANIARLCAENELIFFLLGGETSAADVCKRLCDYGLGGLTAHIGAELSYPTEQIFSGTTGSLADGDYPKLSVMAVLNENPQRSARFGIPDSEFLRGEIPMTRSEVRAQIISKFEITKNDICWDIGCGTGSVSVEMALRCSEGTVFSVDHNENAVSLTEKNARKFHCDNIQTVHGKAPDILAALDPPDRVFLGGTSGEMSAIVRVALAKNPNAVVVASAVSLETISELQNVYSENGFDEPEIIQILVTNAKRVGDHTIFSAQNPVFLVKGGGT